jgi:hypothetical protein
MIELEVNSIDKRYTDIADILVNPEVPESLSLDTFNEYPTLDVSYVDYGYIKFVSGGTTQMFVACTRPNDLRHPSIFLSMDGVTWAPYVLPEGCVIKVYNKVVVYNGDIYLLYDDIVLRLYDFDLVTQSMMVDTIQDDIYDIMINNHNLVMLTHDGIYKITACDIDNMEHIEIRGEVPYSSFVPSLNGDLIILGYGGGYPVFIVYDGEVHYIFCTTKCNIKTAININNKILCYTDDCRIIDVYKTYEMMSHRETVYEGLNWSGNVTFHHTYLWLCYTEHDSTGSHTVVAKSSNGINFDPEVRIPNGPDCGGNCCWGNSYTLCVCNGTLYMLKSSEKESDYGLPFIRFFRNIPIAEDGSVEIESDVEISDFDRYIFNPYICNSKCLTEHVAIRYDIVPHIENNKICFKLKIDGYDYKDLFINAYYYGVLIIR